MGFRQPLWVFRHPQLNTILHLCLPPKNIPPITYKPTTYSLQTYHLQTYHLQTYHLQTYHLQTYHLQTYNLLTTLCECDASPTNTGSRLGQVRFG